MDLLSKNEADKWFAEHSDSDMKVFANKDIEEHLRYALTQVSTNDLFLEFGVRDRFTFNIIKEYTNMTHGFDSWTGMPWPWQLARLVEPEKTGPHLAAKTIPESDDTQTFWSGMFEDTLKNFLSEHNEHISFLHIDSCYYKSANQVLTALDKNISKDTVIVIGQLHAFEQANLKKWENVWNHGLLACKEWGRNIQFFSRNHFLQAAGKIV
tara:strand:- start:945 stop:1574 length:630 start_codon:yes stop_codon:yes gene_type:complete